MTCRYSRITRNLLRRVRLLENGETDVLATKQELSDFESLIDTKISSTYHPAGTKTISELVSSLLTEEHEGEVYNISDSGLTTSDFIEGANNPINVGDNVVVARVVSGNNIYYKFDVLAGFLDTTNFVLKSLTQGLIKNDGSIDTNQYLTNDNLIAEIEDANGHEYVEIGGIKWATMNLGASNTVDYGLYFLWGDTQGYSSDLVGNGSGLKYFGWADYKYGDGTNSPGAEGMTKYNSSDELTVLEDSDDAARVNWGGSWRMSTKAEFEALNEATTNTWVVDYQGTGISGRLFTDKNDSSKTLFFPATGELLNGNASYIGNNACYWFSSLGDTADKAWSVYFDNYGTYGTFSKVSRYYGFTVRGVLGTMLAPKYILNGNLARVAKTGNYNDLSNKPTNISAFNNDSGYLTLHQDISGKANSDEMTITPGTEANADKTTIQLKSGTSATVLTQHLDISSLIASSSVRNVVVCTLNEYDTLVANDLIDVNTEYNIIEV